MLVSVGATVWVDVWVGVGVWVALARVAVGVTVGVAVFVYFRVVRPQKRMTLGVEGLVVEVNPATDEFLTMK